MFGSTVLEVAIGMTFCYASVALIASTIQEAIASLLRLRARTLLTGVKTMCNDPQFTELARSLYSHALVNPHDDGRAGSQRDFAKKPSYIPPHQFAVAVIDTLQSVPGDFEQLGRDIDGVPDPQLRAALKSMYLQADGSFAALQAELARWFDNAMERVSGAYKRRATVIGFLISLLLAIAFNIDSIHLFRTLWLHPAMAAAHADPRAFEALFSMPIGWSSFPPALDAQFPVQAAGWLLTASSSLFGGPFWFDLLQRLVRIRGTGHKPGEVRH
jgi:hypothetical protein